MTLRTVLDDAVWSRVEPLLPPLKGAMGRPMRDHRLAGGGGDLAVSDGVGVAGPAGGVRAVADGVEAARALRPYGVWDKVVTVLLTEADAAGGLDRQTSMDSTITRAHQHATNTRREAVSMTARYVGGSPELHVSARRAS